MFTLITLTTLFAGAALVVTGARRYFRHRPSRRLPQPAQRTRFDIGLVLAGAALLLAPELPASLAGIEPASAAGSFLLGVVHVLSLLMLLGLGITMILLSRFVLVPALDTADALAARVPSLQGGRARRQHQLGDFPRDWASLLAYDQELSRRFLAYDHDLELSCSRPAMRDYTEPATRAAMQAMFACDAARRDVPPPLTRDVITTAYGRAVAEFAVALRAAETNAATLAVVDLPDDERRRLDEALSILSFVRAHSTTPIERDEAYANVAGLLDGPRAGSQTTSAAAAAQPHPWLSVRQRADLGKFVS